MHQLADARSAGLQAGMAPALASDRYCVLAVRDAAVLQRPDVQRDYQQLWGRILMAMDYIDTKLARNPWMAKIMTLETHGCIWERGLRKSCGSRWKQYEEGQGSPTSVLAHSLEDSCDSASLAASEEDDGISQDTDSERNGQRPVVAAGAGVSEGDWSQILDAHSLDEVLSRLSLQSLAKLSCVSKGFQGVAQPKLLGSGALVDFREDLGKPYEPSMLRVPLRAADLPAMQRWDRYSVYYDLVSRLYKDLADASKGGLVYQRSLS